MSDMDRAEKLIATLGQRIGEQNGILRTIAASLQGVEAHLRQMAVSSNTAPNYQRLLSEYPTFDWSSIGSTVLNRDSDGATSVEWNGQVFTRRSPSNKFQCAFVTENVPVSLHPPQQLRSSGLERHRNIRRSDNMCSDLSCNCSPPMGTA